MPMEALDNFSKYFCTSFVKAYRYEILDTNKFKIPIKLNQILTYLQADLNYFCNLAKQKCISQEIVK